MARLEHVIDEIKELRNEITHRSSLRIFNLLDGNKKLFIEKMEADVLKGLVKGFEELANARASEYNSPGFKRDFERNFESLLFHVNRF